MALRDNLNALSEYCVWVKGDVDKINAYFMQNLCQLLFQGEGADDKEVINFAAYNHVPDAELRKDMSQNKNFYYTNNNERATAVYKSFILKSKSSMICSCQTRTDILDHFLKKSNM